MRIFKNIFLMIGALGLIICMGIFIFLQIFDVDIYQNLINHQISKMIGRPSTIGRIFFGVSWQGLTMDIGPVVITDASNFTSLPLATVDRIHVSLDTASLIFHHKVSITHVVLWEPEIHIIRSREGVFNFNSPSDSLGDVSLKLETKSALVPHVPWPTHTQRALKNQSDISLPSISIRNGSLSFIDQAQNFPLDIWISFINADIPDFSLTKPFKVLLTASSLSAASNLHISAQLEWANTSLKVSHLSFFTDLSQLDTQSIRYTSPMLAKEDLPAHWKGDVAISLDDLMINLKENSDFRGHIEFSDVVIENFDPGKMILSHALGTYANIFDIPIQLINGPLHGEANVMLHDHVFLVDHALVATKDFNVTAQGSIAQDLSTDLETVLTLSPDSSASLAQKIQMVGFLLDDNKQLVMPATIQGQWPHCEYKIDKDFRKRIKKAFKKEGTSAVIHDVLSSFLR